MGSCTMHASRQAQQRRSTFHYCSKPSTCIRGARHFTTGTNSTVILCASAAFEGCGRLRAHAHVQQAGSRLRCPASPTALHRLCAPAALEGGGRLRAHAHGAHVQQAGPRLRCLLGEAPAQGPSGGGGGSLLQQRPLQR